jgi:hypothetical protein
LTTSAGAPMLDGRRFCHNKIQLEQNYVFKFKSLSRREDKVITVHSSNAMNIKISGS